MPRFALVNAVVIAIAMFVMLLVYLHDIARQRSDVANDPHATGGASTITYLQYPSGRSAYWYFFGALACVLISYLLNGQFDAIAKNWSEQAKHLLHFWTHVADIVLSNAANACLLVAALAYGLGRDFERRRAKELFFITVPLTAIWAIFWELVQHERSLLFTTLLIAPDIALSMLGFILLGWVIVSRWSGVGVLYFVITILYAIFQLPARIGPDLKEFLDKSLPAPNLDPTSSPRERFL